MFSLEPNNQLHTLSTSKEITMDTINEANIIQFITERVENIRGKGQITSYKHFRFFPSLLSCIEPATEGHEKLTTELFAHMFFVYQDFSRI